MELTEGSETSANHNLTLGKYPKEYTQYAKHGESLKSRRFVRLVNANYKALFEEISLGTSGEDSRNVNIMLRLQTRNGGLMRSEELCGAVGMWLGMLFR
jgi:hypothetical protein